MATLDYGTRIEEVYQCLRHPLTVVQLQKRTGRKREWILKLLREHPEKFEMVNHNGGEFNRAILWKRRPLAPEEVTG
jgi:hypothetical protein